MHELACDIDPSVQDWLKRTGRSKILTSEIRDAWCSTLYDLHTQQAVMRPTSMVVICGWSCVDACGAQSLPFGF